MEKKAIVGDKDRDVKASLKSNRKSIVHVFMFLNMTLASINNIDHSQEKY